MVSQETSVILPDTVTRGRVKWFNNRAGYGFITVSSGEHKNVDVFVHHSVIKVNQEQYRYLVQGEYVDFKLCVAQNNENHKWHVEEVRGVDGEKLMCESRLDSRAAQTRRAELNCDYTQTRGRPASRGTFRENYDDRGGSYRSTQRSSHIPSQALEHQRNYNVRSTENMSSRSNMRPRQAEREP